jgi:hypothetical protein
MSPVRSIVQQYIVILTPFLPLVDVEFFALRRHALVEFFALTDVACFPGRTFPRRGLFTRAFFGVLRVIFSITLP